MGLLRRRTHHHRRLLLHLEPHRPKLHLIVGWVYAVASVCTLIIINGILTFMLTPGDTWLSVAGTGQEASKFWYAFFNPTYWPSLCLRTCVCCSLAGIWALITASRIDGDKQPELKTSMVKWSVKWLVPSFVAMPFLMIWYYWMVPASQRALLTLGIDTINAGTFSTVTRIALVIIITSATIVGVAYFLAYRNPVDFNLSHAMAVLLLALIATGSGEYAREMLRKPYVIGRWMYSNGVRVPYVTRINQEGYLAHSNWVWNGNVDIRATPAAKPSSAASAAPATRSTAIVLCTVCLPAATAPTSPASSPCFTTTSPTRPIAASCRRWQAQSRTSTI